MARVVRFHETGGPEVLRVEELGVPPPGKGEVQIAIKAIGLNRAESMFRRGQYLEDPKLPARLGYEAAGTVAAVGPGVQSLKVGDAVSVIPAFSLNDYGMYADLANAPVHAVVKHPASLSFEGASAVWMQYLTAYGALIDIAGLTRGDTAVIPAASSSVGLAAIQIANRVGAVPVALTRGSSKRRALLDAGAAHVIATDEQDLVEEILGLTGSMGARVVFDPVGGPAFARLARATAKLGILFLYGALSPEPTPMPLFDVLSKWATIRGYVMTEITGDPARLERAKAFVNEGLADGSLRPIVARTFPLGEIVEAHRYLESNQQIGKVVVTMTQIAAELLGLPLGDATFQLSESSLPEAPVEGGSFTVTSIGSAIKAACGEVKETLFGLARKLDGSPLTWASLDRVDFADGRIRLRDDPSRSVSISQAMRGGGADVIEEEAAAPKQDGYSLHAHSAIFAEAEVDEDFGTVRVTRGVVTVIAEAGSLTRGPPGARSWGHRLGHRIGPARGGRPRPPVRAVHGAQPRGLPRPGQRRRRGDLRRGSRRAGQPARREGPGGDRRRGCRPRHRERRLPRGRQAHPGSADHPRQAPVRWSRMRVKCR
jgi:NADPH:quinone reductase-like Zn-dependent oxidoreductase